jgi:hypothetical protein
MQTHALDEWMDPSPNNMHTIQRANEQWSTISESLICFSIVEHQHEK